MFVLKTILFACATVSLAAPTWFREVESRGIDDSEIEVRSLGMYEDLEARGFNDYATLEARADPRFAPIGTGTKTAAKAFVDSAGDRKLADAAARGTSARTVHQTQQFHLDRQHPGNDRHASKVAVQLNRPLVNKGPTTVGQVAVHHGTTPDPKTVGARLKHSINTGAERDLPRQS